MANGAVLSISACVLGHASPVGAGPQSGGGGGSASLLYQFSVAAITNGHKRDTVFRVTIYQLMVLGPKPSRWLR